MKKLLIFILLCILFVPSAVFAEEYCKVISGNGKDLGSEVACGTEHFYVIENKDGKLRLMAKYNLNVGDKIDYFDVEENDSVYSVFQFVNEASPICMEYATEKGYHPYYVYPISQSLGNNDEKLIGCRVYEKIDEERVHQDERAVGTKLVDGKSVLPLYGITYMNPKWGYEAIHDGVVRSNVYDANGDLIISNSSFEGYLNGYRAELERQQISFENLSFVTLNKMLSFLENISGKEIEVELEYSHTNLVNPEDAYIGKMDIKEYAKNIEWVYDITYWLGSGFMGTDPTASEFNDYYISNEGMLCALGRGQCGYLKYPIGNGLRPAITISSDNLRYTIKTRTGGYGTIEVVDSAAGGDFISFRVNANRGYRLQSILVTSDSDETIEFTEGEIIENDDQTVSIDQNKFTMPFENVTIDTRWALESSSEIVGEETEIPDPEEEKQEESPKPSGTVTATEVKVLDTAMKKSLACIIIGITVVFIGFAIVFIGSRKKSEE